MNDIKIYETIIDFNSFYICYLSKMDKAFTGGEFSIPAMRCMVYINSHGKSTQKELSEHFGIDMAYLSRTIKKLTEDGYLIKQSNSADKRSHYYDLTKSGKHAVCEQKKRMSNHILSTVDHLSENKKEELCKCFLKIKKLLNK